MLSCFFFCLVLVFVLLLLMVFLSFNSDLNYHQKGDSFECGFQSFTFLGVPFSMPFFFVSMVFLLFDVEILILCFYPFFFFISVDNTFVIFFVVFLVLLFTLYEIFKGVISWN